MATRRNNNVRGLVGPLFGAGASAVCKSVESKPNGDSSANQTSKAGARTQGGSKKELTRVGSSRSFADRGRTACGAVIAQHVLQVRVEKKDERKKQGQTLGVHTLTASTCNEHGWAPRRVARGERNV
jgi:hypothetical protein